jgi:hypothetical protein
MRIFAVVAAALVLLLGSGAATAGRQTVPSLRLLNRAPITVQGLHFRARTPVRITVLAASAHVLKLRTSLAGGFIARFTGVSADRCSALTIEAVATRGGGAVLKLKPLCPPP